MKLTILGCGGSHGVPAIGGQWGACDPANPKNRRLRASVLVESRGQRILVDTSPDLRQQLLATESGWLDAVIYTHGHADHLHGIDDLRMVNVIRKAPLDIYADAATLAQIESRFDYVLAPLDASAQPDMFFYKPWLVPHGIEGPFRIGDVEIVPFEQDHGFSKTLGFRFGPIAYSTDVVALDEAAFRALEGVEIWVVDALRFETHMTHSHFERTLDWIARVKPKRAILTHMNLSMDYAAVRARCPPGVEPGYDGLVAEAAD
ncbi:MAG TPA: MBL fold metallo-hydrolase [Alphaproteobacteria bacterium]|nr:MBL fold metallo-hydrolase [Alphaproteobacteria bacterium]